ncbi:3-hydroxyisobutyrate dehydrogenase-like beta-hydroxyacid dehydrogenase [Paraburkholderia youngii]
MNSNRMVLRGVVAALALYGVVAHAEPLKANVIHWWTSGGESAAIRQFAVAYDKAGGQWVDNAVAGGGPGARHRDQPHRRR